MSNLIYIASPYSHPDENIREENYRKVTSLAAKLCSEGHVAISPIAYGHNLLSFHEMPSDWEFWQNFCFSILKHCDEIMVYKMPGWDKSKGVSEEIKFAEENNIKISYLETELNR